MGNSLLNQRCCDVYHDSSSTNTIREWCHDAYKFIYNEDISDEGLDKMSEDELKEFIEELDWLLSK